LSKFIFIEYTGDDAGEALARMLGMHQSDDFDETEQVSKTEIATGFRPNPDEDTDSEEQGDDDDETDTA